MKGAVAIAVTGLGLFILTEIVTNKCARVVDGIRVGHVLMSQRCAE